MSSGSSAPHAERQVHVSCRLQLHENGDLRLRLRLGWSRPRWCTATAKRQPPAASRAGVSSQSSAPQAERQVHVSCRLQLHENGGLRLRLRLGWSRPRWCTATAKRQPPAASRAGVSSQSSAPQAERQVHVSCRLQLHENGDLRLRLRLGWSRPRWCTATAKRQPPAASRAGVSSGSSAPHAERQGHVSCRLQLHENGDLRLRLRLGWSRPRWCTATAKRQPPAASSAGVSSQSSAPQAERQVHVSCRLQLHEKCDVRLRLRLGWSRPRWCTATANRQPPTASRAGVSSGSSAPQAERQVHVSCRLQLHENGDLRLRRRLAWSRPRWCTATAKRQRPAASRAGVSSQSSAPQAERQIHVSCRLQLHENGGLRLRLRLGWSRPRWCTATAKRQPPAASRAGVSSQSSAPQAERQIHVSCRLQLHENGGMRLRLRLGWSRPRWCTATAKRQPPTASRAGVSSGSSAPQAERRDPRQLSPPAARKWWLAPAPPTRLVEAAVVHGDCQEAVARSKPRWGELWELSSPGRAPNPRQLSPPAVQNGDLRLCLRLGWSRPRRCTATAKRQPLAASRAEVSSGGSAPQAERQVHASCRLQLHESGGLRLHLGLGWSRPPWCTATARIKPPAASRAGVSSWSSTPQAERQVHASCRLQLRENGDLHLRLQLS